MKDAGSKEKIRQDIINYALKHGTKKAALYHGVSVASIYRWMKKSGDREAASLPGKLSCTFNEFYLQAKHIHGVSLEADGKEFESGEKRSYDLFQMCLISLQTGLTFIGYTTERTNYSLASFVEYVFSLFLTNGIKTANTVLYTSRHKLYTSNSENNISYLEDVLTNKFKVQLKHYDDLNDIKKKCCSNFVDDDYLLGYNTSFTNVRKIISVSWQNLITFNAVHLLKLKKCNLTKTLKKLIYLIPPYFELRSEQCLINRVDLLKGIFDKLAKDGDYHRESYNMDLAMEKYNSAIEIAHFAYNGSERDIKIGYQNINRGMCFTHFGKNMDAGRLYKKIYLVADKIGDELLLAKAGYFWGHQLIRKGKISKAIKLYSDSLKIYERHNDNSKVLIVLGLYVDSLMALSEYDKALITAERMIEVFQLTDDVKNIVFSYVKIGHIFNHKNIKSKAIQNYYKALSLAIIISDPYCLSICYSCIGDIYNSLDDYKLAKENYDKQLYYSKKNEDKRILGNNYLSVAVYHCKLKEFTEGKKKLFKAYKIFTSLDCKIEMFSCLCNIAEVYRLNGNVKIARNYLKEARTIAIQINDKNSIEKVQNKMEKLLCPKKD